MNKNISIEFFLAFLFILVFFFPWADIAVLVKVVGWDMPQIQTLVNELTQSESPDSSVGYYAYALYIIPSFALISIMLRSFDRLKTSKIILFLTSVISLVASVFLFSQLKYDQSGSGIYFLFVLSLFTIAYLVYCCTKSKEISGIKNS